MGSAKGRNNPRKKKRKVVVVVGLARLQVAPWDSDSLMLPACTLFPSFTSSPSSTPSIPLSSSPLGPWGNYKGTPLRLAEEKRGEPFSLCVSEGRGGRKRFIGGKKEKEGKVVRRFFCHAFSWHTLAVISGGRVSVWMSEERADVNIFFFLLFHLSKCGTPTQKREGGSDKSRSSVASFQYPGKDGKKTTVVSDEEDNHSSTLPLSFLEARRTFPGPSSSFSIFHLIKPPPPSLHFPLPDRTRGRRTPLPKVFLSSTTLAIGREVLSPKKVFPLEGSPPLPPPSGRRRHIP